MASTSNRLTENILKEAGPSVKIEYDREKSRELGQSVQTSGGKLLCKRIYFIACPDLKTNANKFVFRKFIFTAITMAANDKTNNIRSMAFPAIGCGLINCDADFVAETLIRAVIYELEHRPLLQISVSFIIKQQEQRLFSHFQNQLRRIKSNRLKPIFDPILAPASKPLPRVPVIKQDLRTFKVEKRLIASFTNDYAAVLGRFTETMAPQMFGQIIRIELIWNKMWYEQYQIHYEEFRKRLGKNTEKWLFHGCSEESANSIIKGYFNRSYAGAHGERECYFKSFLFIFLSKCI